MDEIESIFFTSTSFGVSVETLEPNKLAQSSFLQFSPTTGVAKNH